MDNSGTETDVVLNFGISCGAGGDGSSNEDIETLINRVDNHALAIETLQTDVDETQTVFTVLFAELVCRC